MNDKNLDPQHLRSFLAVAETLHFTSAARTLGISQSTISQHIGRLEEQLGSRLLLRSTKQVELAPAGTTLMAMASEMLRCQDAIFSQFDQTSLQGTLRLGITEDIVLTRFPEVLGRFRERHPEVTVSLTVELSYRLRARLEAGELDMLCGMRPRNELHGRKLWSEPLSWFFSEESRAHLEGSIPLVTFPEGSVTRKLAIEALNLAKRPWHLAFVSENLSGLLAAVRAGYGITAQPAFLRNETLVQVTDHSDLPLLPSVEFISVERINDPRSPSEALRVLLEEHIHMLDPHGPAMVSPLAASHQDTSN